MKGFSMVSDARLAATRQIRPWRQRLRSRPIVQQDGHRHRHRFCVRKREVDVSGADDAKQRLALRVKPDQRLMPLAVKNGYRTPAELRPNAGGKTFRDRLLGRKTRRVV